MDQTTILIIWLMIAVGIWYAYLRLEHHEDWTPREIEPRIQAWNQTIVRGAEGTRSTALALPSRSASGALATVVHLVDARLIPAGGRFHSIFLSTALPFAEEGPDQGLASSASARHEGGSKAG